MSKKYFRVKVGYDKNQFISIEDDELESAMYCFLTESKGIFRNGIARGKDILSISEDWNKAMGWNQDHELDHDDFADLRRQGMIEAYEGVLGRVTDRVKYLIEHKQEHLIGKNVQITELEQKEIVDPKTKALSEKMKVK